MTKFAAVTIAALMLMTVFVSSVGAANNTSAISTVEVRSPVFSGSQLSDISVNFDYTQFAGFYYDIDKNVGSESMQILSSYVSNPRTIKADGLVYTTTIQNVNYKYDGWVADTTYPKMGFLAQEYVPVNNQPDVLSKLILDSDDKYTLKVGQSLDLGEGYSLIPKQIDVNGKKVWLELDKDGAYVDDQVVSTDGTTVDNSTWNYKHDNIGGQDNVVLMRAHVNEVFQGQVDSLAVIEGLWLISDSPMQISSSDTFGKLEVKTIGTDSLTLANKDDLTLSKDKTIDLAGDMKIKTAKSDDVRFYFYKAITAPGTYNIRGSVASGSASWDYSSFAGFYYDLNDNISSEKMAVTVTSPRTVSAGDLKYTTTIQNVNYKYDGWVADTTYPKMGFLAQEYVPVNNQPDVLSKLILDSDDKYTLKVGQSLDLGEGYSLIPKQIDVDGKKVWLELDKDGAYVDDQVVSTDGTTIDNSTWNYKHDNIGGQDNVVLMRAHVNEVFQGQVDSLAVIEGLWLISDSPMQISSSDTFGKLEVKSIGTDSLTLANKDDLTLSRNQDIAIAGNMYFKTADSADLRYYPYAEYTIGGAGNVTVPTTPGNVTVPTTPSNVTTTPTTPSVSNVTTPVNATNVTTPVNATNATNATAKPKTPGFEAAFAVAGLLAVAYLVRRN